MMETRQDLVWWLVNHEKNTSKDTTKGPPGVSLQLTLICESLISQVEMEQMCEG